MALCDPNKYYPQIDFFDPTQLWVMVGSRCATLAFLAMSLLTADVVSETRSESYARLWKQRDCRCGTAPIGAGASLLSFRFDDSLREGIPPEVAISVGIIGEERLGAWQGALIPLRGGFEPDVMSPYDVSVRSLILHSRNLSDFHAVQNQANVSFCMCRH